jgi:hypothetical protein
MILHKELFQFPQEMLPQIVKRFYIRPAMRVLFHCHNSIVSHFLFLVDLFALDHSDRPATERNSWKDRLIHQHQYVHGIAIVGFR